MRTNKTKTANNVKKVEISSKIVYNTKRFIDFPKI